MVPDHTITVLILSARTNVRFLVIAVPVERDLSEGHTGHPSQDLPQGEDELHQDNEAEPPPSLFARHPHDIENDLNDDKMTKMPINPLIL